MRAVSTIVGLSDSPDALTQAISWAQKGLEVATSRQSSNAECDMAFLNLTYQLASLYEISGEPYKAREFWTMLLERAQATRSKSFSKSAERRLQKLDKDIESRNKDKT